MKNRSNIAASILQNPELLEQAYISSQHSEGIGQKELDIYLDSVAAKMETLQNHLQELASITIDSEWLKGLVDFGTGAIKVVTALTKRFGGLNTVIGSIAGILLQRSGFGIASLDKASGKWISIIDKIRESNRIFQESRANIDEWTNAFGKDRKVASLIDQDSPLGIGKQLKAYKGMDPGFRQYIKDMDDAERATLSLGEAQERYLASLSASQKIARGFGNAVKGILSTAGTMLISMAASWLIGKGMGVISDIIHYKDNIKKAGEEAQTKNADIIKESNSREDVLTTAKERYAELRKGVLITNDEIKNVTLPEEEFQEFLSINQQLAESFPGLATGISSAGDAIVDLGTKASETNAKLERTLELAKIDEANQVKEGLPDITSKAIQEMETIEKENEKLEKEGTNGLDIFDDIIQGRFTYGDRKTIKIEGFDLDARQKEIDKIFEAAGMQPVKEIHSAGLFNHVPDLVYKFKITEDNAQALQDSLATYGTPIFAEAQRKRDTIAANNQKIQQNYKQNLLPSLMSIFEANPTFELLDGIVDGKLNDFVGNLNAETLLKGFRDQSTYTNLDEYILDEIIYPMQNAIDSGKIKPVDLSNLLNFNYDDMSVDEFTKYASDVANAIYDNDWDKVDDFFVYSGLKDAYENKMDVELMADDIYKSIKQNAGRRFKEADLTQDDLYSEFSISELKLMDEAAQAGKFDFGTSGTPLNLEGLKDWLNTYREILKEENVGTQTLSDVLNDETFQTDTSKTESHISALSSALDNFRESGELTTEQLHDLQKEVPELAELGDSLTMEDVGDKLWENIGDYATKFHEAMDRMDLSDEGKIQGQNFLNSFYDQFVDIPVSEKNAKKALHDFFVNTEATSAETAAQRGVEENKYRKVIDALEEKYGGDIDWSVVVSILADPSLAEATTEEYIAAVDSQEATVKIRADIDQAKADLDKFVENAEADISAQEAYIARKQAKGSTGEFGYDFREASVNGTDLSNTVFGNIDVADRQVIKWTPEALHRNRDVLKQWEYSPKPGTSSTIMGDYRTYDDLGVAFSPMLQTDHGAEILSPDTVDNYIGSLLSEVQRSHPNGWNTEDLLTLDSRGLVIDGKKIKNIIADVGETAEETSKIMHEVGAPFTETGEFRVTEADYAPIIQNRRNIADETAGYYQYLLDKYDYVKEHGANEAYLNNLSKQIADAQTETENRQADLYNAVKESREADLNWNNTLLEHHQAIGEDLESERTILENNGKVVSHELAEDIAGNRRSQIQAQQAVLNENNRLYENTGEVQYLQNMVAARNAIEDIKSLGTTADQVIWESQVTNLGNSLTALEATATTIQDAITLQEGQGLKPTIDQYQRLVKNGKDQVANLEKQNYYLSRQQNRLQGNLAKQREIGAQINSNNSAIAAMNGNINNWQDNLRNFAGDLGQSLLSALQAAFDESNSPTGLQFSTMKELAAQFEGIEGFDFADIFYNTAQGVKLDADATERLVDAQYQLMTGDLTKRINSQNAALQNLRQTYRETTDASEKANLSMQIDAGEANLNNLYNQMAQYQALYSQAQRQLFSDYGAWQRAQSSENAGATYSSIQGYLATQEQAYKDGLIGTDEFKTYTALFDQWGRDTLKAYTENREKMQRYLTEDASGVANVLTDLVETGFASYDEDTMAYSFNISDMKQAASSIGVSKEFLDYALQRTEDYGFTNDYVRDQIQGELKLSDLVQQTGEAIKKRNELIADGAPQEVIDEYNDKIAQLDQSTENVEKNIQRVVANAGKISASEVKAAVDTINEYKKRANEATTDQQREAYMRQIQNVADEAGIELDELGNIDYVKLNKQYDGWKHADKNAKAVSDITDEQIESVKLEGESIENNETLQSGLGKLKNGWEANTKKVQDYVNTLKGANIDDLMALDLNDGNVVEGLEAEEAALDGLVSTFGLTADEAKLLVPILQELGVLGSETLYNKPGVQGTLGVDVGAAQNYLEAHSAIGLTADDLVFDATNMSLDELQSKMDQLSQAKGMVRIEEQGGQEALAQLEQLEAECQKEYNIKVGMEKMSDMGVSIDEFLGMSKDEQRHLMISLGVEEENFDAFVSRIESNPIRAKIETALSDGSKSVEDLIGLTDEELIAEVGCEASEVDEVRAELEEMAANEYDVKVAINDASIAEIGKSIVAALNGQEYKKDVTLEAKGQDKVQSEAEKPATKKVNIVYEVVQKARDFVGGVVGAVSNFFGGGSKQTASASLDTTAATTALNALKAEASNIPVKLNIDGAVGQIDSLKSSLDEIRNSDPIQIEANNDDAIHKIEDVKSKAESANPKIKIGGENDQAKSSIDQAVALANRSVGRIKISADRAQATSAVSAAVSYANGRTAKIKIGGDTSGAITAANNAVASIRRMIANISINANVKATVTGTVVRPTRPSATPSRPSGHTNTHINDATHYNTTSYSGTLSSIGRGYAKGTFDEDGKVKKSGTAYNMLNYKDMSGYAKGDIAIDKDQESLINELGTESIIYRM